MPSVLAFGAPAGGAVRTQSGRTEGASSVVQRQSSFSIRPDYVGKNVPTSHAELIEVRLPEFDGETGVWLMEKED